MPKLRKYSFKDKDMLNATLKVMNYFEEMKEQLFRLRTNWNDEFIAEVKEVTNNLLYGLELKKELKGASKIVKDLHPKAQLDITFLKTQLDVDFQRKRRNEILEILGFKKWLKNLKLQEAKALVYFLFEYRENLTPELRQEIIEKGTTPELLDDIAKYAEELEKQDIIPDIYSNSSTRLGKNEFEELNDLYQKIVGVCKIVAHFHKDQKDIKDKFTFVKVVNGIIAEQKENTEIEEIESEDE